jgi:AAA15 family ATPase/GTPase
VEKLYLDNYRGFSNQYIEIRNLNFLVGENSTGKSSVLLAISTLFSNKFWFNLDFSVTEGQPYSFDDLVSAAATDRSYFSLGYISDDPDKASFLFELINDGGKPALSKAILAIEGETSYFKIHKSQNDIVFANIEKGAMSFEAFPSIKNWEHFRHLKKVNNASPYMLVSSSIDETTDRYDALPYILRTIDFTAPIRSKPRKTYDEPATPVTSEGGHIPYLVRHFFHRNGTGLRKSLNEFVRQSGLFNDI